MALSVYMPMCPWTRNVDQVSPRNCDYKREWKYVIEDVPKSNGKDVNVEQTVE